MADRQRLFFALWPDPRIRAQIVQIQRALPLKRGRLTHQEDLHATLVFLGSVTPDQRRCAESAAVAVRGKSFDIVVDRTGFWSRPRVAWCGSDEVSPRLLGLVRSLQQRLAACGFRPETRPYRLHVTLARDARSPQTGPLDEPLLWRCDRFVLVTSNPAGEAPRYRVLREWLLGG